jgi:hypothetical protein
MLVLTNYLLYYTPVDSFKLVSEVWYIKMNTVESYSHFGQVSNIQANTTLPFSLVLLSILHLKMPPLVIALSTLIRSILQHLAC